MPSPANQEVVVFLSYCRKDEALAHLLCFILKSHGIRCLMDAQIGGGTTFTAAIQTMIRTADVVLILLTKTVRSSAWVNHEIGYAIALAKEIWPLAVHGDIQPDGMLSTTQSYSLFDWTNSEQTINRLIKELKAKPTAQTDHFRRLGLDHVINSKEQRTAFIVARLQEMLTRAESATICIQAAFSSFALSEDAVYRAMFRDDYIALLLKERSLLEEAARRFVLNVIFWPVRAYDDVRLRLSFQNLEEWMRSSMDSSNVHYVCAPYIGPNRLIVQTESPDLSFLIEGYKIHHTSGYDLSIVKYQVNSIMEAIDAFQSVYQQAVAQGQTKGVALDKLTQMEPEIIRKFAGLESFSRATTS